MEAFVAFLFLFLFLLKMSRAWLFRLMFCDDRGVKACRVCTSCGVFDLVRSVCWSWETCWNANDVIAVPDTRDCPTKIPKSSQSIFIENSSNRIIPPKYFYWRIAWTELAFHPITCTSLIIDQWIEHSYNSFCVTLHNLMFCAVCVEASKRREQLASKVVTNLWGGSWLVVAIVVRGPAAGQRHMCDPHMEAGGSTKSLITHAKTLSYTILGLGLELVRVGNQQFVSTWSPITCHKNVMFLFYHPGKGLIE